MRMSNQGFLIKVREPAILIAVGVAVVLMGILLIQMLTLSMRVMVAYNSNGYYPQTSGVQQEVPRCTPIPTTEPVKCYVVELGESFNSMARKFYGNECQVANLMAANGRDWPQDSLIKDGTPIKVPGATTNTDLLIPCKK
jgi:LysM repeat protein